MCCSGGRCVLRHEVCVVQDGPDSRTPITNDRRERSKPPRQPKADSHCPPSALPIDASFRGVDSKTEVGEPEPQPVDPFNESPPEGQEVGFKPAEP